MYTQIKDYKTYNEQEENDKKLILQYMNMFNNIYERENEMAHFTATAWCVNPSRDKVLMVYHNLYNAWTWSGGHADGWLDLKEVALKELKEETGIVNPRFVDDDIFSLEILTVDGHVKKGKYVSSHLHLNVTYLLEASEDEILFIKEDENSGVRWISFDEVLSYNAEPWMREHVYKKLIDKIKK